MISERIERKVFPMANASESTIRFTLKEKQWVGDKMIYVIVDTQTGVQYITGEDAGSPFTPLIDKDGKPLLS